MKNGERLKAFHLGHINYFTPTMLEKMMGEYRLRPFNANTVSLTWVNGLTVDALRETAKAIAKIVLYGFSTKRCNVWVRDN
jgi:predicted TPR repeat methyltransferase